MPRPQTSACNETRHTHTHTRKHTQRMLCWLAELHSAPINVSTHTNTHSCCRHGSCHPKRQPSVPPLPTYAGRQPNSVSPGTDGRHVCEAATQAAVTPLPCSPAQVKVSVHELCQGHCVPLLQGGPAEQRPHHTHTKTTPHTVSTTSVICWDRELPRFPAYFPACMCGTFL